MKKKYRIINKKKYFMGILSHPLKYQYELATLKYSTTRHIKDIEDFILDGTAYSLSKIIYNEI